MALGLLTATVDTGSGIFLVICFLIQLSFELYESLNVSSELTAHDPRFAHNHCQYRQWFFPYRIFSFHVNFEVTNSLFVSS
jgi:hypothetical protein